jgi:hypothetical protein
MVKYMLVYLIFDGFVSRTKCGFTSEKEAALFAGWYMNRYSKLPTVDLRNNPLPVFNTVEEAEAYFEVVRK